MLTEKDKDELRAILGEYLSKGEQVEDGPCKHKWTHLRDEGTTEVGYRQWKKVDSFYCEKCLAHKRIESDIPEKRSYAW